MHQEVSPNHLVTTCSNTKLADTPVGPDAFNYSSSGWNDLEAKLIRATHLYKDGTVQGRGMTLIIHIYVDTPNLYTLRLILTSEVSHRPMVSLREDIFAGSQ